MWYLVVFMYYSLLKFIWKYKYIYMLLIIISSIILYNVDTINNWTSENIIPLTEELNVHIEKWNDSEFTRKIP